MEAFTHVTFAVLVLLCRVWYSVAVRKTFGPESGDRSKATEQGEIGDQRSTKIVKRPVCYKKATKTFFVCFLV